MSVVSMHLERNTWKINTSLIKPTEFIRQV